MASCEHGRQVLAEVAAAGRGPRVYDKHDPLAQPLHQVVRENLATFYAAIEEGWDSRLPEFVRAEFAEGNVVVVAVVPVEEVATMPLCVGEVAEAVGEVRPVLERLELRLGKRIVVGDVRP